MALTHYTGTGKPQARLMYAQFADGTTWGDKSIGDELSAERQSANAAFQRLLSIYKDQGQDAFLISLRTVTDDYAGTVCAGLLNVQARSGGTAAVDQLKMRIHSGKARAAAGVK